MASVLRDKVFISLILVKPVRWKKLVLPALCFINALRSRVKILHVGGEDITFMKLSVLIFVSIRPHVGMFILGCTVKTLHRVVLPDILLIPEDLAKSNKHFNLTCF